VTFIDELDPAVLRQVMTGTQGEAPVAAARIARSRAARIRRRRRSAAAAVCAVAVAAVYAGAHQGGGASATLARTGTSATGTATGTGATGGAAAGCSHGLPPVDDPANCAPVRGPLPGPAPLGSELGTITVPGSAGHTGGRTVPLYEGVALAQLNRGGGGHYPLTALPGSTGNFAVAGFRSTHGEAFRYLTGLTAGDTVTVRSGDTVYTYTVDATEQTVPGDTRVLDPIPHGSPYTAPGRYLTLTTTAPEFSTTNRFVVWGHLTRTHPY
jgi:sortase A